MQAITALAHLRAAVLYIVDPSEQCGYSLEAQKSLFDNIKPLFNNKPLIVVANKADIWRDSLSEEKKTLMQTFEADTANGRIMEMSNKDDENSVMQVKVDCCEILLQHRVEHKFKTKKADGILNRIHVAEPAPRDSRTRPAFIPEAALKKRMKKLQKKDEESEEEDMEAEDANHVPLPKTNKKKTERDIEVEQGKDFNFYVVQCTLKEMSHVGLCIPHICRAYIIPNSNFSY